VRGVTIRQLQFLVEAAQTQSFARAAERLHVSPAAVSFQIKQVESMCGFALFERIGKKTVLSDAGRALLGYARTVLQELQDADQLLSALRGVTGGRVTIGLISTAKYIVPHMVARFQAEYPGIAIHLRDGNRQEIAAALAKGEIELAVMGRPVEAADVVAEPFALHPSVLVAGPSHPSAGMARLPPSSLAGERFITREEGSGTRLLMEQMLQSAGITVRIAMSSSSNEMIKQAVMAGMGVALISQHTVGLELALGLLRTLDVEGFPLMRSWFVAHRRAMPLLPVHAKLRTFLLQHGQEVVEELEQRYHREFSAPRSALPGLASVRA
jgi:LysR family transcriptional regulator, low CO2-responsive transcriptional regulator